MAFPTAAVIAGGAQLAGQGMNIYAQGRMNKKTRQWNEKMYGVQRADALADWNMQNEYNSPQAQMARLREAGLNPNLVYGEGATAMSSSAPRSSSAPSWNPKAPQFDPGSVMGAYFDTQAKQAQTDNLKAQNTLIMNQAALAAANAASVSEGMKKLPYELEQAMTKANQMIFDYQMGRSLADVHYQTAEENLRKLRVGTDLAVKTFAEQLANWQSQREHTNMDKMRMMEAISALKLENKLKEYDIDLRKLDLKASDSYWTKMLGRLFNLLNEAPMFPERGGWQKK